MRNVIGIVNYGVAGNIHSVKKALKKAGGNTLDVRKPEDFDLIDKIVVPGVGSYKDAMQELENDGFIELLKKFDGPLLGICLGMQILYEYSEEGMSEGLGLMKGRVVKKIPLNIDRFKVPNVGWLNVEWKKASSLFQNINNEDSPVSLISTV